MFEAKLEKATMWKKLIDCLKELVSDVNFDCTPTGINLQSMDSSHVALCNLLMNSEGFFHYNCPHSQLIGVSLLSLSKVLKNIDDRETITLRREEESDTLMIVAESENGKKLSQYSLKLMEIEGDSMSVPDQDFDVKLSMPSEQFARIVREMGIFGDTVTIDVNHQGVRFSGRGDIGEGYTLFRADGSSSFDVKREGVKREGVKAEPKDEDDDRPLSTYVKDEETGTKGRGATKSNKDEKADSIYIQTSEPLQLSFALRYLNIFSKAASLSDRVEIAFSREQPCRIQYRMEKLGMLRWYLAPKVDDE